MWTGNECTLSFQALHTEEMWLFRAKLHCTIPRKGPTEQLCSKKDIFAKNSKRFAHKAEKYEGFSSRTLLLLPPPSNSSPDGFFKKNHFLHLLNCLFPARKRTQHSLPTQFLTEQKPSFCSIGFLFSPFFPPLSFGVQSHVYLLSSSPCQTFSILL